MMNKIKTSKLIELSASTVMLLGIVLVVRVGGASAKAHKLKGVGPDSQVVAHI